MSIIVFQFVLLMVEYVPVNAYGEEQKKIISNHIRRKKISGTVHQRILPDTL